MICKGMPMSEMEYRVVTAPRKVQKVKGVRGTGERYAVNLTDLMNAEAAAGWQYLRAESLPVDEKYGMMGKTQERFVNLLVFQRVKPDFNKSADAAEASTPDINSATSGVVVEPPLVSDEPAADYRMLNTPGIDDEPEGEIPSLGAASRD